MASLTHSCERLPRLRLEDAMAVEFASVQQRLAEAAHVRSGR